MATVGGRFELGEIVGRGGMGIVYRGIDNTTGEAVAVKILRPDALGRPTEMVERFSREAEALRQLNHPNIIKVLAAGHENGQSYIAMEYVEGGTLKSLLRPNGEVNPLPVRRVLEIALDLADALTRAHRMDIIHRDLKPANILIAADGTPRLTDFGVAHMGRMERVTEVGMAVGTLDYLPPEAFREGNVDTRADIWSFGVLLFEMLTGKRPFSGETITQIFSAILSRPTPDLESMRPDCPAALVDLIYRMLEKNRDLRIPSIRLVAAELEAILRGGAAQNTVAAEKNVFISTSEPHLSASTPSTDVPRHNLPVQTLKFVGREGELAELAVLLQDPATRLVTILAPGGMGKTRLALETASRQLSNYTHGVYFVALAPVHSVENIVAAIAEAVGFQFHDNEEPRRQLFNYFRVRKLLLVMDNFEHLLPGANLVADILQAAPGVKVIATSRERLNLSDERVFNLGGMDVPDLETPEGVQEYSAVQLFMHGARRIQPDFELHAEDLSDVTRVCQLVGGMPLGILLAASWIEALSPEEIATEIERNLDFLQTELRDVPERQKSIRAVFEYSWSRLTESEQRTFARCSVFRGSFTRDAAQTVTGANLRELMGLVNKALLRRSPRTGRYEVHELLRQCGAVQLERLDETAQTQAARAAYFAAFVHEREADMKGRRQQSALNEIEADFQNVRAAWEWAVERQDTAAIRQMLEGLNIYCDMRSRIVECSDLFRLAILTLDKAGDEPQQFIRYLIQVRQIRALVLATFWDGSADIIGVINQCIRLAEARQDQAEVAYCLWTQAIVHSFYVPMLDQQSGLESAQRSLELYRQLGDAFYTADVLVWVGIYYLDAGHLEQALRHTQQALDLKRQIGDKHGVSYILMNLSANLIEAGQYEEAEACARESVALMTEIRSQKGLAISTFQLALLTFYKGEIAEARLLGQKTASVASQIHFVYGLWQANALQALLLCTVEEQYAEAKRLCHAQYPYTEQDFFVELILMIAECGLGNDAIAREHFKALSHTVTRSFELLPFGLSMEFMQQARIGQSERAVELLGFASTLSPYLTGWMFSWPLLARHKAALKARLGAEAFDRAWEQGQKLDSQQIRAEILRV